MRILWLSHLIPYPPKGGVLQRAYYLIKEISNYHTIDLVAFNQSSLIKSFFSTEEEGKNEAMHNLGQFCNSIKFIDIPSEKVPYGKYWLAIKSLISSDPYTINWLKSSEFVNAIKEQINTNDYDLVHFDTISLIPYLDNINAVPSVLDHHNIESHMLLRRASKENNIFKSWYYAQEGRRLQDIEKSVCGKFNLNVTCSKLDSKRLLEIVPGINVEDIPNGVDIEYFTPNYDMQNDDDLIFAGRQNWYPNIEASRFITYKLWPEIKKNYPNMKMNIIGANPPGDILSISKQDTNFKVHGFVYDIRPLMNEAAIYICPITDGGGTKLKILDALAMGKAIIAHPIACEGINVIDGENVIFAESVNDYIESISKLYHDKEMRLKLGRSARELAENSYSFKKIGKKLSDMFLSYTK